MKTIITLIVWAVWAALPISVLVGAFYSLGQYIIPGAIYWAIGFALVLGVLSYLVYKARNPYFPEDED